MQANYCFSDDVANGVPRRKEKTFLQDEGRVVKLEFTRFMSPLQVRNTIINGFMHVSLKSFVFLTCVKNCSLATASNPDPDGNAVIIAAQGKKGPIYIAEVSVQLCIILP